MKKKHVDISYHKLWESAASGIVNLIKVCIRVDRSKILKEYMTVGTLGALSDASYGVAWEGGLNTSSWISDSG